MNDGFILNDCLLACLFEEGLLSFCGCERVKSFLLLVSPRLEQCPSRQRNQSTAFTKNFVQVSDKVANCWRYVKAAIWYDVASDEYRPVEVEGKWNERKTRVIEVSFSDIMVYQ